MGGKARGVNTKITLNLIFSRTHTWLTHQLQKTYREVKNFGNSFNYIYHSSDEDEEDADDEILLMMDGPRRPFSQTQNA